MSFAQLIAIKEEAKQMLAEDKAAPILACPEHGEPLKYSEKRRLWACPEGDYQTTRGAR